MDCFPNPARVTSTTETARLTDTGTPELPVHRHWVEPHSLRKEQPIFSRVGQRFPDFL